jgi:hypothetical protein
MGIARTYFHRSLPTFSLLVSGPSENTEYLNTEIDEREKMCLCVSIKKYIYCFKNVSQQYRSIY